MQEENQYFLPPLGDNSSWDRTRAQFKSWMNLTLDECIESKANNAECDFSAGKVQMWKGMQIVRVKFACLDVTV